MRDEKPIHWPDDIEFQYWASTKALLRKRFSNVKSWQKKESSKEAKSDASDVSEDQSESDVQKHDNELRKELQYAKRL